MSQTIQLRVPNCIGGHAFDQKLSLSVDIMNKTLKYHTYTASNMKKTNDNMDDGNSFCSSQALLH